MGRPFDKHIDEGELETLLPSFLPEGQELYRARATSIVEAERHLASCAECRKKVSDYRQVVNRWNAGASPPVARRQPDCPIDIDWDEVAAGLWPELRTRQLIAHAARCAHCGPFLRAAASADEPTAQEEEFLARLKAPSRPAPGATKTPLPAKQSSRIWRRLMDWRILVPVGSLLALVAVLATSRPSSSGPISGMELAQFAASTHEQHLRGNLALEVQTDSRPLLNEWLHEKSQFSLALPESSEAARAQLPYRIEGARLVQIRNKMAAYIAYELKPEAVSLIVAPVSAAVASGGVEAAFQKVTFHYYMIHNYKVVTWSVHGLTYALVSQEGNRTQRSCMVCHSTMRDRDLTQTQTPLAGQEKIAEPIGQ
jgi:anti-sigma factor RsiW